MDAKWVRWDAENVIAVRVYNSGNPGGFFERAIRIDKPALKDFVTMSLKGEKGTCQLNLRSKVKTSGILEVSVSEPVEGDIAGILEEKAPVVKKVKLSPNKETVLSWPVKDQGRIQITYRDDRIDGELTASYAAPYPRPRHAALQRPAGVRRTARLARDLPPGFLGRTPDGL